jgi:hypothetical protein
VAGGRSITVLIPANRACSSQAFLRVWITTRMPEHVYHDGPVRFVMPARAVADGIREIGGYREARAVVAAAVQRRLCGLGELREELASGPRRGSGQLRRALAEVADGIRSAVEGDFADLLRNSSLPMPAFNARLFAAGETFLGIADAAAALEAGRSRPALAVRAVTTENQRTDCVAAAGGARRTRR